MPSTINNQNLFLDTQFQQFVQFAETAIAAGKQKAIARVETSEVGGIANRTIVPGSGDWVGIGVGRLASLKRANNTTRDAFMKAVADMFGGENHIPDSVKDAMKLEDYGKGKPLTARRIMAVKEAIVQALETSAGKELSPKDANRALTNAFLGDEPISQSGMPLEFAVAMRKMINGLHERYFGGPPAQEPTLREFVGRSFMTTIESMRVAANKADRRITLDELMATAKPIYESYAVEKMLADAMPDILKEMGMEDSKEFLNVHSFIKRNPDILKELGNCKSREDVKACIERNRDALKANMQLVAETRTYEEQYFSMIDDTLEKVVGMKSGIPEKERSAINFKNHMFLTSILHNECEDEKQPGFNLADEFKKRVDKLVADYAERFKEAEQCANNGEISAELAKHWKEETLKFYNPKTFFPEKIVAAAKNLDGQELLKALDKSNDSATALKAVSDFAKKLEAECAKIVGGEREWHDAGVDGREPIKQRVVEVLVEKNPGLKDALLSRRLEMRSCYRQLIPEKKDQAGYNLSELLFERNNFEYLGFPHEDFIVSK